MVWKPSKALGIAAGLLIGLTAMATVLIISTSIRGQALGPGLLVTSMLGMISLVGLCVWGYWFTGLMAMRYELDRNALVIHTASGYRTLPLESIQQIVPGTEFASLRDNFRGMSWPGYLAGLIPMSEGRRMWVNGTAPLAQQLILVTPEAYYAISPSEQRRFLEDLAARQALGPVRQVTAGYTVTGVAAWPIWRDRVFWALTVLILVASVALFAYVFSRLGGLPQRIAMRFSEGGAAEQIARRNWLLIIPTIGGLVWAVNSLLAMALYRLEKTAAFLLQTISLAVQLILGLAAMGILQR